ncbi:MAG: ribosomal protein S18-alanine N-acetyltransferase [Acidimicrobiales bacterium]
MDSAGLHHNLTIAAMRRRHLRAVLSIERTNYALPWSAASFLSEMMQHSTRYYTVALLSRAVVGYSGLMVIDSEEAHVNTLTVSVEYHHRGIGTFLLFDLVKEAIDRGVDNLTLEVRASNNAAQALYRRFGFVPVGVRKGYYEETHEDAIIMWANSIRSPEYDDRLAFVQSRIGTGAMLPLMDKPRMDSHGDK